MPDAPPPRPVTAPGRPVPPYPTAPPRTGRRRRHHAKPPPIGPEVSLVRLHSRDPGRRLLRRARDPGPPTLRIARRSRSTPPATEWQVSPYSERTVRGSSWAPVPAVFPPFCRRGSRSKRNRGSLVITGSAFPRPVRSPIRRWVERTDSCAGPAPMPLAPRKPAHPGGPPRRRLPRRSPECRCPYATRRP